MSNITFVDTASAPKAIGPYAQATECRPGRMLFLSGQLGMDPDTGGMVPGGVEPETRRALQNLDGILTAGGMDRWNVARTTIFLVDLADFGAVNAIYAEFFGEHRPARATVQIAALPRGGRVEIDAIAVAD
jgi:2-iminobutanoate/2-iminopropanoate deaminase